MWVRVRMRVRMRAGCGRMRVWVRVWMRVQVRVGAGTDAGVDAGWLWADAGADAVRARAHPAGSPRAGSRNHSLTAAGSQAARTPAYREAVPGVCLGINQIAGSRGKGRKRRPLLVPSTFPEGTGRSRMGGPWAGPGRPGVTLRCARRLPLRPPSGIFPAGPPLSPLGLLPTPQGHSHW